MSDFNLPGTTGLTMNEPPLWERGKKSRTGFSEIVLDVPEADPPKELLGEEPTLPDLSEVEVVRHYTRLSQWNFGVDTGTYPLGSCTMKYNPKINEKVAALPGLAELHPLLPSWASQGALQIMYQLQRLLAEITGLDAVTLQPAAGAHGEYTGMRIFYAYHQKHNPHKNKILIPDTAHGTNPASASMCGYKSVPVKSSSKGVLTAKEIEEHMDEETAGIMVTNPNTLGLFEENIKEVAKVVHDYNGLVYCDGANMNALMGIVDMQDIGIDVLHLNLHKTFSTPHGGGGPGSGPICVTKDLEPFLPVPRILEKDGQLELSFDHPQSIGKMHTFFGNFGVMVKAYAYILSMGPKLKKASQLAVLNANYSKEHLKKVLHLPYERPCMHECVFSDKYQEEFSVSTLDLAKRMIDYGFHPPTIYFPLVVHGAMMFEPTETETKENLDQFIQAIKLIASEARENKELLFAAPENTKVGRMDETSAARNPCLTR